MSISKTNYVVYGFNIPKSVLEKEDGFIDLDDDKLLPFIEGHKGEAFTLVDDGMCGEYTVFGLLVSRQCFYAEEGASINIVDVNDLEDSVVEEKTREVFGFDDEQMRIIGKPKLIIFQHYH